MCVCVCEHENHRKIIIISLYSLLSSIRLCSRCGPFLKK